MRSTFVSLALLLAACSSDDTTPTPLDAGTDAAPTDAAPTDAGPTDAGADAAPADAGVDSGASTVRCTEAEFSANDHTTTNGVDITFPLVATPEQYMNRCSRVKVGQHVGIYGDFVSHPLEPSGGDTPTFIPTKSDGDAVNLTPSRTGVFGFQCAMHPDVMFGAVEVVP